MADHDHAAGRAVPSGAGVRAPRSRSTRSRVPKDWVVLDALNHVKDRIDGTLSYRWSCRMGVCGSCGMMVNGEPKLTCATFLADYAPGPVRVEPLRNFPGHPRSRSSTSATSCASSTSVKPWLIRKEEKPLSRGRVPADAGAAGRRTSSSACASTACCATRRARSTAWIRSSSARRRIALAQRYNLDSRDQGAPERMEVLSEHEGIWGCTFVGECTKVCPKHVDPAGAIQRYKLTAALDWLKAFVMPRGAR